MYSYSVLFVSVFGIILFDYFHLYSAKFLNPNSIRLCSQRHYSLTSDDDDDRNHDDEYDDDDAQVTSFPVRPFVLPFLQSNIPLLRERIEK